MTCALALQANESGGSPLRRSIFEDKILPANWSVEEMRRYKREWIANRRAKFFSDKSCVFCGSVDRLELDHVDPKLKVSSCVWSWTLGRRLEEIAKCRVLCRDCHSARHAKERRRPAKCGTASGYRRGCRCADCTKYQTDRMARYHTCNPRKKSLRGDPLGTEPDCQSGQTGS